MVLARSSAQLAVARFGAVELVLTGQAEGFLPLGEAYVVEKGRQAFLLIGQWLPRALRRQNLTLQ